MKDEEFVSKTINVSSIDLEKFPASKVRQLAKKIKASKATVHHIKQDASDPEVAPNQSDETSAYKPPTKQTQEETTIFQVKTTWSQEVVK